MLKKWTKFTNWEIEKKKEREKENTGVEVHICTPNKLWKNML